MMIAMIVMGLVAAWVTWMEVGEQLDVSRYRAEMARTMAKMAAEKQSQGR